VNRNLLAWTTCATMLLSLYLIFMYAPTEATMGDVQRIFYFHFASHWVNFLAIFCVFIYSVRFLIQREKELDVKASSAAEVGLVFATIGLLTGMLWAKPVWGIWWTWDARLTSALLCWLLYAGYLMLRNAIEEPTQRATFAAVFSIFAFIDVPIVIFSIKWWRTQHPQPVFWGGGSFPPDWKAVFGWQMLAVLLVGVVFTLVRLRQEQFQREIDSLRRMAHAL